MTYSNRQRDKRAYLNPSGVTSIAQFGGRGSSSCCGDPDTRHSSPALCSTIELKKTGESTYYRRAEGIPPWETLQRDEALLIMFRGGATHTGRCEIMEREGNLLTLGPIDP